MRSIPTAEANAISAGARSTWARVRVDSTGTGVYVDLSNINGYDWIEEVTWTDSSDNPMATATITLNRSMGYNSIAPMITLSKYNSTTPLLAIGRQLYIETYVGAPDIARPTTGWVERFVGFIDEIEPAAQGMTLTCRDLGAVLADAFVEVSTNYGLPSGSGGNPLQTAVTSILNDWVNTPLGYSISVTAGTGAYAWPTFIILDTGGVIDKVSVLDAIRQLVMQTGYVIRYMYGGTDTYALRIWNPPRSGGTISYTFTPDLYYSLSSAKLSRMNIRNRIVVTYIDRTGGNVVYSQYRVDDTTSQAKYGRRYQEMTEDSASQIATPAAAANFANAALSDLANPLIEQTAVMPFFGALELGDTLAWQANRVHYDTNQTLCVTSFTHTINKDGAQTEVGCRGTPVGAYRTWLRMAGTTGVAPNVNNQTPPQPTGVVATPSTTTLTLDYALPDGFTLVNWANTTVYYKVEDGAPFTQTGPNAAGSYAMPTTTTGVVYQKTQRATRFTFTDLTPGTQYRFAIVSVSSANLLSAMSVQMLSTPQSVGIAVTDRSSAPNLLANGDFNAYSRGVTVPPDAWTVVAKGTSTPAPTAWTGNSAAASCWSRFSNAQTGTYSAAYSQSTGNAYTVGGTVPPNSQLPELLSDWITIQGNTGLMIYIYLNCGQITAATGYSMNFGANVESTDAGKTTITQEGGVTSITTSPIGGVVQWVPSSQYNGFSATARYIRVRIGAVLGGTAAGSTLITGVVDRVTITSVTGRLARTISSNTAGLSGTTPISSYQLLPLGSDYTAAPGEPNRGFTTTNMGTATATATVTAPGIYNLDAVVTMGGATNANFAVAFNVSGATINASGYGNSDGVQQVRASAPQVKLYAGDTVGLKFLITSTGQRTNTWSFVSLSITAAAPLPAGY